jgi:hypothetical protein
MFAIYTHLRRLCLLISLVVPLVLAQESNPAPAAAGNNSAELSQQVIELRSLVQKLQARVDELEKRSRMQNEASASPNSPTQANDPPPQQQAQAQTVAPQPASPVLSPGPDFLHGATINLLIDGYYGYNFNNPIGRVNLLRAYDISSNAFSLNQAALVVESAADPDNGKRFGLRLDLQYGQATETLQGNPSNEPRPDIYRNVFQAYGTYVFPVGKGLTVDFGKFASSLGIEGNYTQDQINYSRSYWFNFLPFYHMGLRVNYKFTDTLALNYWIVNGTQQTEPFNGFKDQFVGFTITPSKNITWNVNYYLGQEHPDVIFHPNGGAPPNLPTEQGVPFQPILNPPAGKLHIFDTYVAWQTTPKLTLAAEADDEIERLYTYSSPSHTDGGAAYIRYQLMPKVALAGRAEYLSDRGGLFTGATQALKETTLTTEYRFANGFLARGEWRRDFSNQPYFLTDVLGILKKEQNTATLGLVWWTGGKQGAW